MTMLKVVLLIFIALNNVRRLDSKNSVSTVSFSDTEDLERAIFSDFPARVRREAISDEDDTQCEKGFSCGLVRLII